MARKLPAAGEVEDSERAPLYKSLGGREGCLRLSKAFYGRVERDPVLRPFFPGTTFKCAIEEFAAFLAQFLGGPSADSQKRWWLSLRESHLRFKLGAAKRDAWMANMVQTLDHANLEEPLRSALVQFFEQSSAYVVNSGAGCPVEHRHRGAAAEHADLSRRWNRQQEIDKCVAAIRDGDAGTAIQLARGPGLQSCDRTVICGLLAAMIRSGHDALLAYVHEQLLREPALAHERCAGRTLLHEAAAAGDVPTIELLLRLGANPNAPDGGKHTPLYSVGNECVAPGAGAAVRALAKGGAKVDACDGVKRCTALHMAARRGNVEAAAALLDSGAEIEARDSQGETALRRAVNCGKVEVAALLVSKGADAHSRARNGGTPQLAAKSDAMKHALQTPRTR